MEKYFNTEGLCNPRYHYMVPLDDRLYKIRQRYVERGSYFVINRGRQYGKTTTLRAGIILIGRTHRSFIRLFLQVYMILKI